MYIVEGPYKVRKGKRIKTYEAQSCYLIIYKNEHPKSNKKLFNVSRTEITGPSKRISKKKHKSKKIKIFN